MTTFVWTIDKDLKALVRTAERKRQTALLLSADNGVYLRVWGNQTEVPAVGYAAPEPDKREAFYNALKDKFDGIASLHMGKHGYALNERVPVAQIKQAIDAKHRELHITLTPSNTKIVADGAPAPSKKKAAGEVGRIQAEIAALDNAHMGLLVASFLTLWTEADCYSTPPKNWRTTYDAKMRAWLQTEMVDLDSCKMLMEVYHESLASLARMNKVRTGRGGKEALTVEQWAALSHEQIIKGEGKQAIIDQSNARWAERKAAEDKREARQARKMSKMREERDAQHEAILQDSKAGKGYAKNDRVILKSGAKGKVRSVLKDGMLSLVLDDGQKVKSMHPALVKPEVKTPARPVKVGFAKGDNVVYNGVAGKITRINADGTANVKWNNGKIGKSVPTKNLVLMTQGLPKSKVALPEREDETVKLERRANRIIRKADKAEGIVPEHKKDGADHVLEDMKDWAEGNGIKVSKMKPKKGVVKKMLTTRVKVA